MAQWTPHGLLLPEYQAGQCANLSGSGPPDSQQDSSCLVSETRNELLNHVYVSLSFSLNSVLQLCNSTYKVYMK